MLRFIQGTAVLASLFAAAPAFAQWYGPSYGYSYDNGSYDNGSYYGGPAYGDGPVIYDQGPASYGGPGYAYPGPVYEGRSVAVAPTGGAIQEGMSGAGSVAWCEDHYKTYSPQTGTFMGYDGRRHPCP